MTRVELAEQLRTQQAAIEEALHTRALAIDPPSEIDDPEYHDGFRRAVLAAFDFTVMVIEREGRVPPIPVALLGQARLAARNSVGLDTVLRRYSAGSGLLDTFIAEASDRCGWSRAPWRHLARDRAHAFDSLLSALTEEHQRERARQEVLRRNRTLRSVMQLLEGGPLVANELHYLVDHTHLGLVCDGTTTPSAPAVRDLASSLDARLLLVRPNEQHIWAWLSRIRPLSGESLDGALESFWPSNLPLAIGDPCSGLAGWRLSHRQAAAVLALAGRGSKRVVRYSDSCLLATVVRDDLLAASLWALYIEPLLRGSEQDDSLLRTLTTYFQTSRNGASTASALGVSRQTVSNHLRAAEKRLGRTIAQCGAQLEVALELRELASSDTLTTVKTSAL